MNGATIHLTPEMFTHVPFVLLERAPLRVELFRYAAGTAAARVVTDVGQVVVLPFDGQRIWDAEFHGRTLTMRSTFDEPLLGVDYLGGNGAYFIHCGGSAMGNPGAGDEHPLHGELPDAPLRDVTIRLHGSDDEPALTVRGTFVYRRSFGAFFEASLGLTIRAGSGVMRSRISLTNRSAEHRPLMYLAHINMRPAVGGRVLGAATRSPIRSDTFVGPPGEMALLPTGAAVDVNDLLAAGMRVEPELVQSDVVTPSAGEWTTTTQIHADGAKDVVTYNSAHLRHTVRWLRRSADDEAFGFALPASAEPDGFHAESAKGNVEMFPPGASLTAVIDHGALRSGEVHVPLGESAE